MQSVSFCLTPSLFFVALEDCSICYEPLVAGLHEETEDDGQGRIYETCCRHVFHIHCLHKLIPIDVASHNGHNGLYGLPDVPCPLCRQRMSWIALLNGPSTMLSQKISPFALKRYLYCVFYSTSSCYMTGRRARGHGMCQFHI